ncbi:unnamed protein product [Bursaphelenchus xylophilus]|uniref:(pine wood nematode) hypothetical protein n=1 Tax=Bursaphelenchus xylophilus TaxID=6326 RepID=A0A1I7SSK7_BURXY|nr:unnamed protein product [Bursaphelenchus xylophilus]CAG9097450.1 unnamed protein product [Bursaphelenchus xylophilus]
MSAIRAVIFDLGGVLYPFRDYSKFKYMCQKASADPKTKKNLIGWQEGALATSQVRDFFEQTFGILPKNVELEKIKLEDFMGPKHEKIWKCIKKLKQNDIKTALLTNNGWWTDKKDKSVIFEDLSLFDVVVESCKEGICKPNPRIFEITLNRLGLKPSQCAFIDDLEKNVESANRLGINGIQMVDQDQDLALDKLQQLLSVPLK